MRETSFSGTVQNFKVLRRLQHYFPSGTRFLFFVTGRQKTEVPIDDQNRKWR